MERQAGLTVHGEWDRRERNEKGCCVDIHPRKRGDGGGPPKDEHGRHNHCTHARFQHAIEITI